MVSLVSSRDQKRRVKSNYLNPRAQTNGKINSNIGISIQTRQGGKQQYSPILGQRLGQVLGKDDVTVLVELVAVLFAVFDAARHAHDFDWLGVCVVDSKNTTGGFDEGESNE